MASAAPPVEKAKSAVATLLRFMPLLWPRGEGELKARVIGAVLLVLAGKGLVLLEKMIVVFHR